MTDELLAALDRLRNAEILAEQETRCEVVFALIDCAINDVQTALNCLADEAARA